MKLLPEKLGLKAGNRLLLADAPPGFDTAFRAGNYELSLELRGAVDHILAFVTSAEQLDGGFECWKAHLHPDGKLWICWPKTTRPFPELNIKSVIRIGYAHGMVESNAIRIDEGWSGLKFTHPKAGKEYHNSYGTLNTDAVIHYRQNKA